MHTGEPGNEARPSPPPGFDLYTAIGSHWKSDYVCDIRVDSQEVCPTNKSLLVNKVCHSEGRAFSRQHQVPLVYQDVGEGSMQT